MKTWLIAVVLGFAAVASVVGVGCGGDGEEGPSATATPVDRATLEDMLSSMIITVEDLPAGFALEDPGEQFTDNEEAAEVDPTGQLATLSRLEEWGRLLGYRAAYMTNDPVGTYMQGGIATITVSVSIFETAEGAETSLEWGRGVANDPAQAATMVPGVLTLETEPMSFPSVGDEMLAGKYTGTIRPQGMDVEIDVDFVAHVVAFRQDRVVAQLLVSAIGGAEPGEEVEDLARLMEERIAEVLE